jgi:predicted phosphodiesterase
MKIALITDTHFGCRNDNLSFIEYFRKFYAEIFFPYLKNHNIDTIIHLGDIVDRRKFINFNSLKAMHDIFIQPIIDNDITLHAIIGNHDTYYKNTNEINSMQQLYGTIGYEKIKWYGNSPELINIDGCEIMLLPWICSGNYERFMSEVEKTKAQILFGHLELKGFEMHKGAINYDGFDPNVFNKFDIVCSGHFHHKSTSGNINYLGSPYEMTWADYNDPRGFHIFDTETRELVFVRNTLKMFHKIVYDDSNTTLDEIVNKHFDKFNECYVKVIIREKNNPYWFDLFMEKIEKSNPVHVQVVEDHLNLDLENDDTIVSEAEDTITILNKYIDGLDINVDKQNLEKIIKELYSEALSVG